MSTDIVLIGPMGAGKSTLGKLLSEHLGLPQCSMDELRWDYYKETDDGQRRSPAMAAQLTRHLWSVAELLSYAVERLLLEHRNCVIDFRAGHSVFEDDALFDRVQKALAPYSNVILLLPSPDLEESIRVLRMRNEETMDFEINAHFVTHHSNHDLAKKTVYTQGKTPEQTRDEILAAIAV